MQASYKGELTLRSSRSFIQPAMVDLEIEAVGGGGRTHASVLEMFRTLPAGFDTCCVRFRNLSSIFGHSHFLYVYETFKFVIFCWGIIEWLFQQQCTRTYLSK